MSTATTTAISLAEPGTWRHLLEAIRDGVLDPPPAASLIGLDLLTVEPGRTVFGYRPRPEHGNPSHVHGGVLAVVADFAVSTAVATLLPVGGDVVTADLHVSYIRRVELDGDPLECTGRVVHLGRSQANAEATAVSAGGDVVFHAVATCRVTAAARA
jgi:uncharacterized protein (TIGR00369 family)